MLAAIFFTILPTILFYLIFNKLIKSTYLKISFSWFCGQYILALLTFLVALILSFMGLSGVLQKALIVLIICLLSLFLFTYKQILLIVKKIKLNKILIYKTFFLLLPFLFSIYFYKPHLKLENGSIYTSPVYWDFQWHAPLIQNFAFGDNFPPQNESFAGLPMTYHLFWGFLTAIYVSSGLDLVYGLNYISITCLFFLLVSIIGFGEELFRSFKIGILAAILTVTSSSLRFIDYFNQISKIDLFQIVKDVFTNTAHPYFFSFVAGNPAGYNGTMFNMFYFLAERQMVIGVIFLLFFTWLVYERKKISNKLLLMIGALAGVYFLWHLFITVMVLCSLFFLVLFDKDKKKSLILLLSFSLVFLSFAVYFKILTYSIWFYPDIKNFPKINFNFPTMNEEYPFSIKNAIGYYFYAYGLKLIFLITGLFFLLRINKKLFVTLLSVIVPTFILINTVQLSPVSVYDNHKWLRPMNVIVDLLAAFAIYKIMTYKKNFSSFIFGIIFFILITLSGILELMPFLNSLATNLYADYQSPLISNIRANTEPRSTFLGKQKSKEIHLAGRKLFLSDYSLQPFGFRKDLRERIISEIYSSNNLTTLCSMALRNKIDYIEFQESDNIALIDHISKFDINQEDGKVSFIDVKKSCGVRE